MERWLARPAGCLSRHICFCRRGAGLGRQQLQPDAQVSCPMNFHLIGVNHNSAPLEVRERLAVTDAQLPDAVRTLVQQPGVDEGMVLSTCNRVEVLTSTQQGADLRGFLRSYFGVSPDVLHSHIYEFQQREAVRHVFRVASSLDSMVVGESQILGQVKEAYAVARGM